jgi:integrase
VTGSERPKAKRPRWRILEPVEVGRVLRAFTDEQARVMFLTLVLTGLRRFELQGLRWRDVDLVEQVLRVRESKTEEGERSIALSPTLVEALVSRLERSAFKGADEFVFCHPTRGTKVDREWYADEFREALAAVGITEYVRPFHDLRHTSLTNGARGRRDADRADGSSGASEHDDDEPVRPPGRRRLPATRRRRSSSGYSVTG